jgi:hypothetical protein
MSLAIHIRLASQDEYLKWAGWAILGPGDGDAYNESERQERSETTKGVHRKRHQSSPESMQVEPTEYESVQRVKNNFSSARWALSAGAQFSAG